MMTVICPGKKTKALYFDIPREGSKFSTKEALPLYKRLRSHLEKNGFVKKGRQVELVEDGDEPFHTAAAKKLKEELQIKGVLLPPRSVPKTSKPQKLLIESKHTCIGRPGPE
jgi:hypothetical protein